MADFKKRERLVARSPRGFADRDAADIRATERMLATIRSVYERYGFEPVETPFVETTEALGKFLPDEDRPNEGVFSFQDDDGEWLSLRYDLTAPLARYVAENFDALPKPYRSYRAGWVFRNEKPGPGRFRQFMQFDADTVGAGSPAADAEMCMMMADVMEALGIPRGQYVVKVNNRKVLDGVMEAIGLAGEENAGARLKVLRAVDKLDRLGAEGVRALLGPGRRDESGDFTPGAGLDAPQADTILAFVAARRDSAEETVVALGGVVGRNGRGGEGVAELGQIADLVAGAGYDDGRVVIDPAVVRGLEYYTGPVYEAELTFQVPNERGEPVVFGSVGGGGRYDGLVGRFRGEDVPATGFSIGVSRLAAALRLTGRLGREDEATGPVVVTVMDRDRLPDYQRLAARLREGLKDLGVGAEMYLGSGGLKAQLKYADRRDSPCAVIQGSDERARGVVQIKDLALGKELSRAVADHAAWTAERPAQFEVREDELVERVRDLLRTSAI